MSPETIITASTDVYIMQSAGWIDKKTGKATHGIPLGYADIKKKLRAKLQC